jgi:hypothetical protein
MEAGLLSRLGRLQDHFQLDHRRVGVADRDQEVNELNQQVIYLPVVDDAPVVCTFSPDDVYLAKGEQAGKALAQIAVLDKDILPAERVMYTHQSAA